MPGSGSVVTLKEKGYTKTTMTDILVYKIKQTEYTAQNWPESDLFKKSRFKKSCEICGGYWKEIDPNTPLYFIETNLAEPMVCKECALRIKKVVKKVIYIPLEGKNGK